MNLIPVLIVGALFIVAKKGNEAKREKALRALGPGTEGQSFGPDDLPDIITTTKGERFTIRLPASGNQGLLWKLVGTPPGEIVVLANNPTPSPDGIDFVFDTVESGSGSIVFHFSPREDAPPEEIIDIKIKVQS
jgi:hypothetical protein